MWARMLLLDLYRCVGCRSGKDGAGPRETIVLATKTS